LAEAEKWGLKFSPENIRVVFEINIHLAIRKMLHGVKVFCCRFHLGQSWWRKIQNLGLTNDYKNYHSESSSLLRKFFGLPFLPQNVTRAFRQIKSNLE